MALLHYSEANFKSQSMKQHLKKPEAQVFIFCLLYNCSRSSTVCTDHGIY